MVFEKIVISLVLLIPGWTKVSSVLLAVAVVVCFLSASPDSWFPLLKAFNPHTC